MTEQTHGTCAYYDGGRNHCWLRNGVPGVEQTVHSDDAACDEWLGEFTPEELYGVLVKITDNILGKDREMTTKELAARLNGRQYRSEITPRESQAAKEAGLVVMFGYSDDNVEVQGAICGEYGAWEGATLHITPDGILEYPYDEEDNCLHCKYFRKELEQSKTIKAVWHNEMPCWTFETEIPHETFNIYEYGELFCAGIVYALSDVEVSE